MSLAAGLALGFLGVAVLVFVVKHEQQTQATLDALVAAQAAGYAPTAGAVPTQQQLQTQSTVSGINFFSQLVAL
jgi:hypothetical protein